MPRDHRQLALTCRYYCISRQVFYIWRRRYGAHAHGLDGLRDRFHRPQVSRPPPAPRSSARSSTCASTFLGLPDERLPFRVEVIQTDNGAEFGSSFHWHVLDKGTGHVYIKPRTPRLNGKVERSHRIDAEEFYRLLDGVVIDDAQVFNHKLREWEDFYNYHRPHGSLGGLTPMEASSSEPQPGCNPFSHPTDRTSMVVRSFSTTLKAGLPRPPAAAVLAPAATWRAPRNRPHHHARSYTRFQDCSRSSSPAVLWDDDDLPPLAGEI